jgi:TolA-binding protein
MLGGVAGGAAPRQARGQSPAAASGARRVDPAELEQFERDRALFEAASRGYRSTIGDIVRREYDQRRKRIEGRYDARIKATEAAERTKRLEAIAMFEAFLQRYPRDPRFTPDVLFRLAELYFEKSNDEFLTATDSYDKQMQAWQASGSKGEVPPPPKADYGRTIALYQRLIKEFPSYRHIDGAHYLLGYCLGEEGKEAEARQAYLALVCHNRHDALATPEPAKPTRGDRKRGVKIAIPPDYDDCTAVNAEQRFLPETWTRIGELHFDYNELELSIAAYAKVLQFKDSPYYDKALYKLAWAYYRLDAYLEAIARFDELIRWSDAEAKRTGGKPSDLRAEAVQYVAISLAEPDWDGDLLPDGETALQRADRFFAGRAEELYVREVYAKIGDILFDTGSFEQAVRVYQETINRWPLHPEAPVAQSRIVLALERQREFERSMKERELLATQFASGTPWSKANRDKPEAVDKARQLAEEALIQAAAFHHRGAQELKRRGLALGDEKLLAAAKGEYELAAAAYADYLQRFAESKNGYEYRFYYAESLYWSQRFAEAATEYQAVRDSNVDDRFREEAAFSVVKSYEEELKARVAANAIKEPPIPEAGKTQPPIAPVELPEVYAKLQKAEDEHLAKLPNSARNPALAYAAALISYRHLRFDEARQRFADLRKRYCSSEQAADAADGIVASWTIEGKTVEAQAAGQQILQEGCGTEAKRVAQAKGLKDLLEDLQFKQGAEAMRLGEEAQKAGDTATANAKFEEAATLFDRLVEANPRGANADKALNNAAVCNERVNRYAKATALYERIYRDYPKSTFADEALFRAAENYKRFFEFDRASEAYILLADDPRFKTSEYRTDALLEAAALNENDQNYRKAADLYRRYAKESKKPDSAAEAAFRAAVVYEKMGDRQGASKAFRQFVKDYGSGLKQSARIVDAHVRIGKVYEASGQKTDAKREYEQALSAFAQRRLEPGSDAAEPAAIAAFRLAEFNLESFEKRKVIGGGKKLERSVNDFAQAAVELEKQYDKVASYRRFTWAVASFYRKGYVYEIFSKALLAAPVPPELARLGPEAEDVYRQTIEQLVSGIEAKAIERYKTTLDQAKKFGAANEWSKKAATRLNAFKPDEYPLLREERASLVLDSDG